MEGVDNEKEMKQGQLMRDLDGVTRRYAMPISNKYTSEQLKSQIGKETGVVFIAVLIEWVKGGNTPGNRQQITNRVGPLLGDAICCRVGTFGGGSKPTGAVSISIQKSNGEGPARLGRGFVRLTSDDGVAVRRGVALHEKHSLTACAFTAPKNDSSTILRGSHTLTTHHRLLRLCTVGERDWGSRTAMQAAAAAVKSWVEQLYGQEVVTTRVGTVNGNIDTDEGMLILEYCIRWQERERGYGYTTTSYPPYQSMMMA